MGRCHVRRALRLGAARREFQRESPLPDAEMSWWKKRLRNNSDPVWRGKPPKDIRGFDSRVYRAKRLITLSWLQDHNIFRRGGNTIAARIPYCPRFPHFDSHGRQIAPLSWESGQHRLERSEDVYSGPRPAEEQLIRS